MFERSGKQAAQRRKENQMSLVQQTVACSGKRQELFPQEFGCERRSGSVREATEHVARVFHVFFKYWRFDILRTL